MANRQGRPRIKVGLEEFRDVWDLYGTGQIRQSEAARRLGVTSGTFHNFVIQMLENNAACPIGVDIEWEKLKFIKENNL